MPSLGSHCNTNDAASTSYFTVEQWKCPLCGNISVKLIGFGDYYKDITQQVLPLSPAKKFDSCVPYELRKVYEEAYLILDRSPMASATFSRRALQYILRDYYKVKPQNLINEISDAEKSDLITSLQNEIFNAIRILGNISAHPPKDVSTIVEVKDGEAEAMIKYIEHLIETTYVERAKLDKLKDTLKAASVAKSTQTC